jgi:hypothetical protein
MVCGSPVGAGGVHCAESAVTRGMQSPSSRRERRRLLTYQPSWDSDVIPVIGKAPAANDGATYTPSVSVPIYANEPSTCHRSRMGYDSMLWLFGVARAVMQRALHAAFRPDEAAHENAQRHRQ